MLQPPLVPAIDLRHRADKSLPLPGCQRKVKGFQRSLDMAIQHRHRVDPQLHVAGGVEQGRLHQFQRFGYLRVG